MEIARAAASRPRVILLDEPFSGLNPAESKLLSHALAGLNRSKGIAMVLVEHDVEIVFGLSERVFVLDFGVIIATGSPAEIQRDPAVRVAYLGDVSPGAPDPAGDEPGLEGGGAGAGSAEPATGGRAQAAAGGRGAVTLSDAAAGRPPVPTPRAAATSSASAT